MAYAAPEDVAARLVPDASARACDTIRGSLTKGGLGTGAEGGSLKGAAAVKDSIVGQFQQSLALGQGPLTPPAVYEATALSLRNVLLHRLRTTEDLVASSVRRPCAAQRGNGNDGTWETAGVSGFETTSTRSLE